MNRRQFSLGLISTGAAPAAQRPRPSYVSRAGKDESPLDLAQALGNKFITSNRAVYPPNKTTDKFYRWHYPTGVALWALCQVSDLSGDPAYLDFVRRSFDYYIEENKVRVDNMNDGGCFGHALLDLHKRFPDRRYLEVIAMTADYYEHSQPRLLDGSLCYVREPERRRTWIDALFIVCPFLAKSAELLSKPQFYDDVFKQFFNYTVRLQDPKVKLYYQGWGWGTNPTTHSPGFWSRGDGWVLMAMTEVLKSIPSNHAEWKKLLAIYQDFANAVLAAQGATGMWHQLMTRHDSFEETSGTAMFVYSFIHGHQRGWLSSEFRDSALKGFEGLKRMVDVDGNIYNTCIGTGTQDTLDDYYRRATPVNDAHGIGPVILAACAVSSV